MAPILNVMHTRVARTSAILGLVVATAFLLSACGAGQPSSAPQGPPSVAPVATTAATTPATTQVAPPPAPAPTSTTTTRPAPAATAPQTTTATHPTDPSQTTCAQYDAMSVDQQDATLNALLALHGDQTGGQNLFAAHARAMQGCYGNSSSLLDDVINWN